jgi:hypothetical protein
MISSFPNLRMKTPTLVFSFFKPQKLLDSLFIQTDRDLVNVLEERPIVAIFGTLTHF